MNSVEITKEKIKEFLNQKQSPLTTMQIMNGVQFLKDYGYVVTSLINCGAFGVVMKANDENQDRIVAIKQITVSNSNDLKQAILEFQKVDILNHPNIIKFYKQLYDDENEAFFIIQEYCSKGNLQDHVKQKQLTQNEIILISQRIIEGVKHIHSKKMIHSDLKPQNILIAENEVIKICDLGFSKVMKGLQSKTSVAGGTLWYMPQEQINGQIRLETDIFAIGAIIYYCCGFTYDDNMMAMLSIKNGTFPPIENNQYKDIIKIAQKMMTVEPQLRLSLQNALEQLQQLIDNNQNVPQTTINYQNGSKYEGQIKNNLKNGRGILYYNESDSRLSYEGQWKDDQRSGSGTLIFKNGNKYQGEFKDDQFNGKGIFFLSKDSHRYEGNFKDNYYCGQGTYYYGVNETYKKYEGEWTNDKKHGKGVMEYSNGNKYEGSFTDGQISGKGILYYNEKDIRIKYEGQFLNEKRQGNGTLYFRNGNRYEGNFENDTYNGKGIFYLPEGDRYEGNFKNNWFDGLGTYYYKSNGIYLKYVGEWKNDKKHGKGVMEYKNGNKYEGSFFEGSITGKGTLNYNESDSRIKYEGDWQNENRHGQGILQFRNGNKYQGQFVNDKYNGYGVFYLSGGDRYEGNFKDNFYQGQGTYFYSESQTFKKYVGEWMEDKKHGQGTMEYKDGTIKKGTWKDGEPVN